MVRLLLSLSLLLSAGLASPRALWEAPVSKHLPIAHAKLINLDKNIISGAELDDAKRFVIAYYVDDGTGRLQPPLYLDRYDKKREEWKRATERGADAVDTLCFGSALRVQAAGSRLFLDTHINPSAGCLLVLSAEFKLEASLYGWLLGRLGEDRLIYHRSAVHFAPVHPAEIALFDLRTKRDATIFPPKPDSSIRRHGHCNCKTFAKEMKSGVTRTTTLRSRIFRQCARGAGGYQRDRGALAFLISYEQTQVAQGNVQKPSGPKDVLYVYRRVNDETKMEHRETLLKDEKARFGTDSHQTLLQPEILQKISARTHNVVQVHFN